MQFAKRIAPILIPILTLALCEVLLLWGARTIFDFHDMSAFLDAAYRWSMGQKIYRDFLFNSGPVHVAIYGSMIQVFGFNQYAIGAMLVLQEAFLFTVLYLSTGRLGQPQFRALSVALIGSIAFWGPIRHPWYDQTAWIFATAGLCTLLVIIKKPFRREYVNKTALILAGCIFGLSILSKTNIGVGAFALASLCSSVYLGALPSCLLLFGGLLFFLASALFGGTLTDFISQTIVEYHPYSRLLAGGKLIDVLMSRTAIFSGLLLASCAICAKKSQRISPELLILLGVDGIWLLGNWTGTIMPDTYFPHFGVALMMTAITYDNLNKDSWYWGKAATVMLAVAVNCSLILTRSETPNFWAWRLSNTLSDFQFSEPGFRGWQCAKVNCEPFEHLVQFLREQDITNQSLLIYPDSAIIYGLLGIESFKPAPFTFRDKDFPAPGLGRDSFRDRFLYRPPKWVVINKAREVVGLNDYKVGFFDIGILDKFKTDFRSVAQIGDYYVYLNIQ